MTFVETFPKVGPTLEETLRERQNRGEITPPFVPVDTPKKLGLIATTPAIQNLLDIERKTGGAEFLDALNQALINQGRKIMLHGRPVGVQRLIGKLQGTPFGETASVLGLPALLSPRQVSVNMAAPNVESGDFRRTLQGRNPYVQSLLDTLFHELAHVADKITPGASILPSEEIAYALTGELPIKDPKVKARIEAIRKFLGIKEPAKKGRTQGDGQSGS